jgi:hypothetical protein
VRIRVKRRDLVSTAISLQVPYEKGNFGQLSNSKLLNKDLLHGVNIQDVTSQYLFPLNERDS